ncbi:purine-binding chemotaxis protein CheW [Anoxybacterium hadale]|uniref:Purine-binding chemotaxis protein CheW n=1 Tax=Anoxybacterium hadale TaxID=3408580 RepID=A0ACD1AEK7_9FIRM|nr:purine-binding chemotaxis protein CheW [Clostridiales bacterium]
MTQVTESIEIMEDTQKNRFLTFAVGKEIYGIEIMHVTEIIGIQSITAVPELPDYLKGIINLRGKIIPVMDVRLRFKKEPKKYDDRTCVIVIDVESSPIGLIVDNVAEVLTIPETDIVEPPKLNNGFSSSNFVNRIGKTGNEVKLLLDCRKLLSEKESAELNELPHLMHH